MSARLLAILCALALLPSVELIEQGAHVVEHLLIGEAVDHDAHHEDHAAGDEHGCTELVHVCGAHHGLGLTPTLPEPAIACFSTGTIEPFAPSDLHDLPARAPPYRPPIG